MNKHIKATPVTDALKAISMIIAVGLVIVGSYKVSDKIREDALKFRECVSEERTGGYTKDEARGICARRDL